MTFLTELFGESTGTVLNSAFALGIVLVLIVLGLWALKMFSRAGTTMSRGRNRRINVVDSVMVDPRRQLLIIRRDNVEHLILTGGPQDLIVESGIPVADPQPARRPPNPPVSKAEAVIESTIPATAVSRDQPTLGPRSVLRRTGLLRPDTRQSPGVIPMAPALRVDNSKVASLDSAKPGPVSGNGVETRIDGGSQRIIRDIDRPAS